MIAHDQRPRKTEPVLEPDFQRANIGDEAVAAVGQGHFLLVQRFEFQNNASARFQPDTNLNTICSLVPGKIVSVALSSSASLAAN